MHQGLPFHSRCGKTRNKTRREQTSRDAILTSVHTRSSPGAVFPKVCREESLSDLHVTGPGECRGFLLADSDSFGPISGSVVVTSLRLRASGAVQGL
uniref:Uncharacterized protein n=1 Tax=Knipowitschia caucasica TaxID=637954 RepID=A0AAV2MTA0_KNICA